MLIFLLLPINSLTVTPDISIEIEVQRKYQLNKDSIEFYPLEEVMAAIAYHECFDLSRDERWLVMEAFHNRLMDNFNNNGTTVKEQLLAPRQFTGLWKYNSKQWKYDSTDKLCVLLPDYVLVSNEYIIGLALMIEKVGTVSL